MLNWDTFGLKEEEKEEKKSFDTIDWDNYGIENKNTNLQNYESNPNVIKEKLHKVMNQKPAEIEKEETEEIEIENNDTQIEVETQKQDKQDLFPQTVKDFTKENDITSSKLSVNVPSEPLVASKSKDDQLKEQWSQKKNQNVFSKTLTNIKDFVVGLAVEGFSVLEGLKDTTVEGDKARKEQLSQNTEMTALDRQMKFASGEMTDEEKQNYINNISKHTQEAYKANNETTRLYVADTLADFATDAANGLIESIVNVINFFDPKKDASYYEPIDADTLKIPDYSPLKNTEAYGEYSTNEELGESILEKKKQRYIDTNSYNPTANFLSSLAIDITSTVLLQKAGMSTTGALTTTSALKTLGETGSAEDSMQSALTSYIFGKTMDNKTIATALRVPTSVGATKLRDTLISKFPSLTQGKISKTIMQELPNWIGDFSVISGSNILAGEAGVILNNGDITDISTQKQILTNSVIWGTVFASLNSYSRVKFTFEKTKLNEQQLQKQLDNWYDTLQLEKGKQYSLEELKKQYRNLAKKYHTDVGGSNEQMVNINLAYEGLSKYLTDNAVYSVSVKAEPVKSDKGNASNSSNTQIQVLETGKSIGNKQTTSIIIDTSNISQELQNAIADNTTVTAIKPIMKDNEVIGFEKKDAIVFNVENSKIDAIQPAIIVNDENQKFDVIDMNTGSTLLVNQPNAQVAIKTTQNILQSADEITIKEIEKYIADIQEKEDGVLGAIQKTLQEKISDLQNNSQIVENKTNTVHNTTPNSPKQNISNFYTNKENYIVPDIKKVTDAFGEKQEYSKEEISEIWTNEIRENEYDISYDNEYNMQGYIDIEADGNDLVINQYNNEENIIKSEIIPSENGKYNAAVIKNTIEKVSSIYDENTPISGQVDIEGNEVGSIKKLKDGIAIDNIEEKHEDKANVLHISENEDTISLNNMIAKENGEIDLKNAITNIKKSKDTVNRYDIKTLIDNIDFYLKKGRIKIIDKKMEQRAGHNQNPNIIKLNNIYPNVTKKTLKIFLNDAFDKSMSLFRDNIVNIKDTNTKTQIKKSGLDENYNKNYDAKTDKVKVNTADTLDKIIEEGIYGYTTFDENDPTKILHHNYFSVVNYNNKNELVRTIIKEYPNQKNIANSFYYQKIESLDEYLKQIEDLVPPYSTNNSESKAFEHKSSINNSITHNTKNVKSDTVIINNSIPKTKNNTNIQDFGEKIGGARKDLAHPKSVIKTTKEVTHDYTVTNTENGFSVNFKKKILKDGFKTQSEAEQYILDFKENMKNNMAFVQEKHSLQMSENKYLIYLRNPRTLKSEYTGKVFTNKLDAESYAIALSIYLKEHGKNLFRPEIQKVERINPEIKNATTSTGNNILNDFGFKGGEFGNWVNQTERQQFLNYAQDAFTDLAIALDIEPTSLGQNSQMNIAFGARGKGLTGAVAHFEPVKRVINMTRLKGAGSLAHEYGHSIDNYLSRIGGYSDEGMATTNVRNPELSDNMKKAINNVVDALQYNYSTDETEVANKNAVYEKNRKNSLQSHMGYLDRIFKGEALTYKYNRKTKQREQIPIKVTEYQKQEYQRIKNVLMDGNLQGEANRKLSQNTLKVETVYPEEIAILEKMFKEVVGRKIDEDTLYWLYRYGKQSKQITSVKSESAFYRSAVELDKMMGRKSRYFAKIEEMWARAFEAYISDKLKQKGITNTYLVHSVNNDEYALFNPFPAGEERKNINKAFDNLIETMKKEGLLKIKQGSQKNVKDNDVRSMKKKTTNVQEIDNQGKQTSTDTKYSVSDSNKKYETVYGDNGKEYQRKIIRAFKDQDGNEFRLYELPNNHNELSIKEKGKNGSKTIRASRNEILKEIQKYWKGQGTFTDIDINKNVNNTNPTSSEDIRYLKKTNSSKSKTVDVNPVVQKQNSTILKNNIKTNAEREEAFIEQEIKKLERTKGWDENIPTTSRTEILTKIENFLDSKVRKGLFRQHAYAIYKTSNDIIRSKELKDLDSIFHELGHALDARYNPNKETVVQELLEAIERKGYDKESESVQLSEGWAEVIRQYLIQPDVTIKKYPDTVKLIEGLRNQDAKLNAFIEDIQQSVYNYIHQTPDKRLISNVSIGEKDSKDYSWNTLKTKVVKLIWDKDFALKSTVNKFSQRTMVTKNGKYVEGNIYTINPSKNPYYLVRLASGRSDKIQNMLQNGIVSKSTNKKVTPGLAKLGKLLGDNPQRWNDLRSYLVARRNTDYMRVNLKTGIRNADADYVINKFEKDTEIQKAASIIYRNLDGVLAYAVQEGLVSPEAVKSMKKNNLFYVPMQRIIEGRSAVGSEGDVKNPIKHRTGSENDVVDVLENIITNSAYIIQQIENNEVIRTLFELGEEAGFRGDVYDVVAPPMKKLATAELEMFKKELEKQGIDTKNLDLEATIDIWSPNTKTNIDKMITSFVHRNGKRVYLQFYDEQIFNSVMGLNSKMASQLAQISRTLNMPLRYGATMANLEFAVPNIISDTAQAYLYSDATFIPALDNIIGVLNVLSSTNPMAKKFLENIAPEYAQRTSELYDIYLQSGASSAGRMSPYRVDTQNKMGKIYGSKNKVLGVAETKSRQTSKFGKMVENVENKLKPLAKILDILTYIPELSENSTRFRNFEKEYNLYISKGMEETDARIKAAINAKDITQDFNRMGTGMREVNQFIPFSAARVGSGYRFAEEVKKNPKRFSFRLSILLAITLGIKELAEDDKEIEEITERKKADNFIIQNPFDGEAITIKKPQGIAKSIINFAEYMYDLLSGDIEEGQEGAKLAELLKNSIMDNAPADSITGFIPNFIQPFAENALNKDFYYNNEIVKSYDENKKPEDQYYEYNSQTAILLGKIFKYSPAKIDNLISGYLAGVGTQITNITDSVIGLFSEVPKNADMGASSQFILKRFFVNAYNNSQSVTRLYEVKDELAQKKEYGEATDEELLQLQNITQGSKQISDINKQIKSIKTDLTTSAEEKGEKIRKLQELKTDTARYFLGKELINEANRETIENEKFISSNVISSNGYKITLEGEVKAYYIQIAKQEYENIKNNTSFKQKHADKNEADFEAALLSAAKNRAKSATFSRYGSKKYK